LAWVESEMTGTKRKRAPAKDSKKKTTASKKVVSPKAVDLSHQTAGVDKRPYRAERLAAMCDKYVSEDDKTTIDAEGLFALMEEMEIDETAVDAFYLLYLLGQEESTVSRAAFETALSRVSCDSVAKIRVHLRQFGAVFHADPTQFKEFYSFVFRNLRDEKQKQVPVGLVLDTLPVVLSTQEFPLLQSFIDFLKSTVGTSEEVKKITQDQWNVLLDFLNQMDPDMAKYDETAAWPCLFDDFVDWFQNSKKGK